MKNNIRYYAYVNEKTGKVGRVARIGAGMCDGWEENGWKYMPGLIRIENDITDFYRITSDEARRIVDARKSGKKDLVWKDYIEDLRA